MHRLPFSRLRKLSIALILLFSGCAIWKGPGVSSKGTQQDSAWHIVEDIPDRPEALKVSPVKFKQRKPERWVLDNGLIVFYYHDNELPLIRGGIYLPGGSLFDPPDLPGLAQAVGSQMREGSVGGLSPEAFDQQLDDLGASIESHYGDEFGVVGFSALAEDFTTVFQHFSHVVQQPAFAEKRLLLWKKLSSDSIQRRRDNPQVMAHMAFKALVYGEDSPYSWEPTLQSVGKISSKELRTFHKRFVRPQGARLAIYGSVEKSKVQEAVNQYFGSWSGDTSPLPPLPEITHQVNPGVYVLERDFQQTTVLIGHQGPPRLSPDMYSIAIFNRLFGADDFDSMLFNEIRTKAGFAYVVYGGLFPGPKAGVFQIELGTRVGEAVKATKQALFLSRQSQLHEPNKEELKRAKSAIERSFIFQFAETGSVVSRTVLLEILGYPPDYNETYLSRVAQVSSQDVFEVPKKWVHPDNTVVVIVGKVSPQTVKEEFQNLQIQNQIPIYSFDFDNKPHSWKAITFSR